MIGRVCWLVSSHARQCAVRTPITVHVRLFGESICTQRYYTTFIHRVYGRQKQQTLRVKLLVGNFLVHFCPSLVVGTGDLQHFRFHQ